MNLSLYLVRVLSVAASQDGRFHWGELTLSDEVGKPKVHSILDSSLVSEGGVQYS